MKFVVFFTLVFLLSACATSPYQDFTKIKKGMDKTDVLDLAGSPTRKQRLDDAEIWSYTIYDQGVPYKKEVYFKDERVTYSGDTLTKADLEAPAKGAFQEVK